MFNICTALCTAKDGASDSLSDCWKCEQHITEWNITWLMTHAAPCVLNIYYYYYRQAAQRAAAGIVFTHELRGRFFGFFLPQLLNYWRDPKTIGRWNDGMDLLYHHADWWKSHNAPRCEATKCLLFLCHAYAIRPLWCTIELIPPDIASAFVGRFRCGLQIFSRKKSPV